MVIDVHEHWCSLKPLKKERTLTKHRRGELVAGPNAKKHIFESTLLNIGVVAYFITNIDWLVYGLSVGK